MVKKLKQTAIFSNKKYRRDINVFLRKENAIKKANKLRKDGYAVIRDKNNRGHFLWISDFSKTKFPKPKTKSKPKVKWDKTGNFWKSRVMGLGVRHGIALKAIIRRDDHLHHTEYFVTYETYSPKNNRWSTKGHRSFKYKKPDDKRAMEEIKELSSKYRKR